VQLRRVSETGQNNHFAALWMPPLKGGTAKIKVTAGVCLEGGWNGRNAFHDQILRHGVREPRRDQQQQASKYSVHHPVIARPSPISTRGPSVHCTKQPTAGDVSEEK
jgi:hypothetical protein